MAKKTPKKQETASPKAKAGTQAPPSRAKVPGSAPGGGEWKPATAPPKTPPVPPTGGWKVVSGPAPSARAADAWKALSQSTVGTARTVQEGKGLSKKMGKNAAPRGAGTAAPAAADRGTPGDGPVRAVHGGEPTKQDLHLTRSETDRKRLRADVGEKAAGPGVIKTVDWAVPKPSVPPTPAPQASAWTPVSPAGAPVPAPAWKPVLEPPKPTSRPRPAGPAPTIVEGMSAHGLQLPPGRAIPPELVDPQDPFPITADDVMIDYYPILEPYAYVLVTYNNHEKEILYRVIEPRLTPEEKTVLGFIEHTMVDLLDAPPEELKGRTLQEFLKIKFEEILYDYSILLGDTDAQAAASKEKLLYYLFRDFIGEGRIDVFTRDDLIEDISCDGAHQPIFIYHRKYESIKSSVKFKNDDELESFVIRMAQRAGKHISIAEPILDATMRDGSRLQATLAREVSAHGSSFTIRKFRQEPFTPPDLVRFGTQSAEILAYWWIAIQHGASAIYAGGTASGKTTSLNAILLFIPYQMKIVSIEDTRELSIPHPNWIAGITRSGFGARDREGRQAGEIDMFQLLKNALRQRPEYIIVGEVRGKEAYNLFQAMATGHAAYGTMHADSVDSVIHRLESDPINIPRSLLEALDIISIQIQTRVGGKRVRRTKQIAEIVGLDPHTREILTNEVFRWVPKDDSFKFSGVSYILERIQVEKGVTPQQMRQEIENRVEVIKYMIRHNIRNYRECARVIAGYYKDAAAVMQRVRDDEPWT